MSIARYSSGFLSGWNISANLLYSCFVFSARFNRRLNRSNRNPQASSQRSFLRRSVSAFAAPRNARQHSGALASSSSASTRLSRRSFLRPFFSALYSFFFLYCSHGSFRRCGCRSRFFSRWRTLSLALLLLGFRRLLGSLTLANGWRRSLLLLLVVVVLTSQYPNPLAAPPNGYGKTPRCPSFDANRKV